MRFPKRNAAGVAWLALVFGLRLGVVDLFAQTGSEPPWAHELLIRSQFTVAYRRACDRDKAIALLKNDPLSPDAFALLINSGRTAAAIDLAERIVRDRPDRAALLREGLVWVSPNTRNPRELVLWPKLDALKKQVEDLPHVPARQTEQVQTAPPAPASQRLYSEGEFDLIQAWKAVARARESLAERREISKAVIDRTMASGLALLRNVAEQQRNDVGRQALELLAAAEFEAGQLRAAEDHYSSIAQRYPDDESAWAAELRAAQLIQNRGEPDAAAERFARVAETYADKPTVTTFARFYEARAYEAAARWPEALRTYRAAFEAWPEDDEMWTGLNWKSVLSRRTDEAMWPFEITRRMAAQRIDVLTRVVGDPWSGEIERATWLLEHQQPAAAQRILIEAERTARDSDATARAQSLRHRTDVAIATAGISSRGRVSPTANRTFARLCRASFDSWSAIGCAVYASALATNGRASEAASVLRHALARWSEAGAQAFTPSTDEIAVEASDIRRVLSDRDRTVRSDPSPPFQFISATFEVTTDSGRRALWLASPTPPNGGRPIWLTLPEVVALRGAIERLSACDGAARSERIDRLWRPILGYTVHYCMAGGNGFITGPGVKIHFLNPELSRAHIVETFSSGGSTAIVEKTGGDWFVTRVTSVWVY